MKWYLHAILNYSTFDGRARREEYWMFTLINIMITFAISALGVLIKPAGAIILLIYVIAIIIPNAAVTCRRLHDTNRSGWMQLINMIPFGAFVLLFFLCEDSSNGENEYGPNPKEVVA